MSAPFGETIPLPLALTDAPAPVRPRAPRPRRADGPATASFETALTERQPNGLKLVLFAGGGGSCEGIEQALRELGDPSPHIDVAINHEPEAIAMHRANHPRTRHYCQNVWQVRPQQIIDDHGGRPIDLLWASPDCKHFSKAKGGKPVEKNIRDLGWVVHTYTRLPPHLRPRVIYLENVEEYQDWGPEIEIEGGKRIPCPLRKGLTFRRWKREFVNNGYKIEVQERRASIDGTPTIRKRLYVIARCDGQAIVFPPATHGPGAGLKPFRTAAECIDFARPCPSIFGRRKDLADATLRRIARGIDRYVLRHADPFLIQITHQGDDRVRSVREPTWTSTTAHRGETALVAPHITKFRTGATGSDIVDGLPTVTANSFIKRPGGSAPLGLVEATIAPVITRVDMASAANRNGIASPQDPVNTITSAGPFAVTSAVLAGCGGRAAQSPPKPVTLPMNTPTAKADQILVQPLMVAPLIAGLAHGEHKERPGARSHSVDDQFRTIHAQGGNQAVVAGFLAQNNTGMVGHDARESVSTIVQKGSTQSVVAAHLLNMKGSERANRDIEDPTATQTAQSAHQYEVRAVFAVKYYGTAIGQTLDQGLHSTTAKARMAEVEVEMIPTPEITDDERYGAWWVTRFLEREGVLPANEGVLAGPRPSLVMVQGMPMVDIGMRMLDARELFNAQGFPRDYIIDRGIFAVDTVTGVVEWRPLTKTAQIRMCGNSVCPPVARALVLANHPINDNRALAAQAAGDD